MAATIGIIGAVGSVASAGSGILGGIMGGNRSSAAAGQAQADEERAMQFQQGVYQTAGTNLQPWITGGQEALGGVEQFLGLGDTTGTGQPGGSGALASYNQFTKTPFYTFPLQQNTDTMNRAAAAKGMSLSGGQVADLGKYAGGYSASNFKNFMDALTGLSGVGQTSSTQLGQIGTNIGQQVGQTATQMGGIAIGNATQQNAAQNSIFNSLGGLVKSITGSDGLLSTLNNQGVFGSQTGSSYTPASFGNDTGYTTGGFYGGNQPIV